MNYNTLFKALILCVSLVVILGCVSPKETKIVYSSVTTLKLQTISPPVHAVVIPKERIDEVINLAISEKNIAHCGQVKADAKAYGACVIAVAAAERNVAHCYHLGATGDVPDAAQYGACISAVAVADQNIAHCSQIKNDAKAFGDCVTAVAVAQRNVAHCGQVKNDAKTYGTCVSSVAVADKNVAHCYHLGAGGDVPDSAQYAACVTAVAVDGRNVANCEQIKNDQSAHDACVSSVT